MNRLLREPLLHFLLLGVALFGVYGWMRPTAAAGTEEITVSAGQIEHFAIGFARSWQRPPTLVELKGLVDDYVKEEILGREAIALGLDRNDTVIRRRLRQKMEFLAEDLALTVEPSEAELEAHLRAHPADFLEDSRTSFRHVFLREERGEQLEADAAEILAQLRRAGPAVDASMLGDATLLPDELTLELHQSVSAQFGSAFADALDAVAVGEWAGPLRSPYGLHLVLVTERSGGRQPALDEVRDRVRRELLAARRERMNHEYLEGLLEKYEVTIEWPRSADDADVTATAGPAGR